MHRWKERSLAVERLKEMAQTQYARYIPYAIVALWICVCNLSSVGAKTLVQQYRQPVSEWPKFEVDESVQATELGPLNALPEVEWHTPASEALGKLLFFDPRLSVSGQFACASCHHPSLGWTDGRRFAAGHDRQEGNRNSMTLLNVAYFDALFWDGRAEGLRELMLEPIQNPIEMNADIESTVHKLNSIEGYKTPIEAAFGDPEMTPARLATALASFVRTRVSFRNRFDRFATGEYDVLNEQEIEGLHLFRTKARCMNCHHGPFLSDAKFHHTGLSYFKRRFEDLGRFEHTNEYADRGKFKTPSLRDLKFTGPWMHNGLFTNFTGILRMYNHGVTFNSRVQKKPQAPPLSPLIQPLGLSTEEIAALEAFLFTLSRIPHFVEAPNLPDYLPQNDSLSRSSSSNPPLDQSNN